MAIGQVGFAALAICFPGLLAFISAVVAENKKPADPSPVPNLLTQQSTCHYPKVDITIVLGIVAAVLLFISAVIALVAFYFPYNGKRVSVPMLWRSTSLFVFTVLSMVIFFVAEALLLWAILVESSHRVNNVHSGIIEACPSAKAGLFGGAGFLALDATLFFLIVLMLTTNARADYLMEDDLDEKGSYGEVTNYPAPVTHNGSTYDSVNSVA